MINHKIVEYIQQNIDAGYDIAAIRKRLIDHGYPQNDIDDTVNHVQQQSKNSQKAIDSSKLKGFGVILSSTIIILVVAIALGLYFFVASKDTDSVAPQNSAEDQIPTGQTVATAESIYEDGNFTAEELDVDGTILPEDNLPLDETEEELTVNETNISVTEENIITEEQVTEEKIEEFKFSPESIVNTQHNISFSLDNLKHEIKGEYWGKITEITTTILNNGSTEFKPKVLVMLYDEADFKEEWLKPKAEIEFDIEKLNVGEHITRQAIVNIAFDNLTLTKNFKLVLVNSADPANHPIVVVEKDFNARTQ